MLQHSLDGPNRALSHLLRGELGGIAHRRLSIAARLPLEEHVRRTGLADVVLDTHPYTAHTTVADAFWLDGPPWLALGAGERFDTRLSSTAVHHLGLCALRQTSLRGMEDAGVALLQGAAG